MGWILIFGPIVSGILITLLQLAIYRLLVLARIIKREQVPIPPVIIMRSFLILMVVFAILYFTGYMRGFIEPVDPTKPPPGTKQHEAYQEAQREARQTESDKSATSENQQSKEPSAESDNSASAD